jgi:hypothetical protein
MHWNADGLLDLVVGAPHADGLPHRGSGAAIVYASDRAGAFGQDRLFINQTGIGVDEPGDQFGAVLAEGSRGDLFVAAPNEAPGPDEASGVVFVFPSEQATLRPQH